MMARPKLEPDLIVAIVLASLFFSAGWLVNGWRIGIQMAEQETKMAKADKGRAEATAITLANAQTRGDELALQVNDLSTTLTLFAEEKNREIDRLSTGQRCLDAGLVRVLNRTPNSQPGRAVSETAGQPIRPNAAAADDPDDGTFATDGDIARWINQARTSYDTCRGKLDAIRLFYQGSGKLSDIVERGQEREEEMRQDALADWARKARTNAGDSAEVCAMCGEPIPEERQQAVRGVQTCLECQNDIERLGLTVRRQ